VKAWRVGRLIGRFFALLVLSNLTVIRHVLSLRPRFRPAVLAIDIDAKSDWEVSVLANLICLTPGTLALDVSSDKRVMYVHVLEANDPEAAKRSIQGELVKLVREAFS
jgi:multicomponent Na+:H+ antiporter subunit E